MEIIPQLIINSLISGSIYALASSGLALSYGLLRILNFAHGHLMMTGVYIYFYANSILELGVPASALFTIATTIALAIFVMKIFVTPFLRLNFILTFATTLALSNILESIISMVFGVNVKSLSSGELANSIEFHGIFITPIQIIIILSALILLSTLAYIIHFTSIGRKIRALSENDNAANSLGIKSSKYFYLTFIIGMLFASFAGVMVGYETNIQPTMGGVYTIKAFAAMILGGLGNLWGTIIGSFVLGLVENFSIGVDFWGYSLPAGYKDAFAFTMILIVLLFKPQGLFNKASRSV